MDSRLVEALNAQIQAEMDSANIYLAMSAHFYTMNLEGFAKWMQKQHDEEMVHAMKFFHFLVERGEAPEVRSLPQPKKEYSSVLEMFEAALEHEKVITSRINALYELAIEVKDYPTQSLLKWYIDEQVEEEANAMQFVHTLKSIGDSGSGIYILNKEAGNRA